MGNGKSVKLRNRHPVEFVILFRGRVVVSICVERSSILVACGVDILVFIVSNSFQKINDLSSYLRVRPEAIG